MFTFLTHRHVIIALIVTPILAVLAYYGMDIWLQEKPKPSQAEKSYPLSAQPNCRYASGQCNLQNARLAITLTVQVQQQRDWLLLESNAELEQIIVDANIDKPKKMQRLSAGKWRLLLPEGMSDKSLIKLAITRQSAYFYAQVPFVFAQHKPIFNLQ